MHYLVHQIQGCNSELIFTMILLIFSEIELEVYAGRLSRGSWPPCTGLRITAARSRFFPVFSFLINQNRFFKIQLAPASSRHPFVFQNRFFSKFSSLPLLPRHPFVFQNRFFQNSAHSRHPRHSLLFFKIAPTTTTTFEKHPISSLPLLLLPVLCTWR